MQTKTVQGIFVCLIAAGWALLLLSLFMSAVRLSIRLKAGARGGAGRVSVEWLIFRYTLPLRINLLRQPYMTVELVLKNGETKLISRMLEKELEREAPALPPPDALSIRVSVGLKNEPALSALLSGALCECSRQALAAALPAGWPERMRLRAEPLPCADVLFLRAEGMIMLTPAQIIAMGIQMRKRGA